MSDERTPRMKWEHKLAAANALAECSLKMREPGNWYVSQSVEGKRRDGDCMLCGICGNGVTPEEAVIDHWRQLTEEFAYLVTQRSYRRHHRWTGFMWEELEVEKHFT